MDKLFVYITQISSITLNKIGYDAARNRASLTDPDYGTLTTVYDAYGRLKRSVSPREQAAQTMTVNYYDGFDRLVQTNDGIENTRTDYSYLHGYLRSVADDSGHMLWKTKSMDAQGRLLEAELGNGAVTRHTYDTVTHRLQSIVTTKNLQNLTYDYDKFGNLAARKDHKRNMEERFEYDDMNRLTGITLKRPSGQDLHCAVTYDALGRMTSKEALTAVNGISQVTTAFSQPVFETIKIHAISSAQSASDLFPAAAQNVTYTSFEKANKIKLGNDSLCYTYGYDHQRIRMEELVSGSSRTKDYVGLCEYVTETTGNATTQKSNTYLMGPYGVFAVVEKLNGTETLHYILKDNLGSWVTITNGSGTVEQQLSYDAWGNLRNPNTWANYTSDDTFDKPMFDRGYTGHEHLYDFGLINMNGRMYDPVMSLFLSADRYVQDPLSAQGFNRYAYCLYNPLRYVDPTGWLSGSGGGHGYGDHPPGELYYVNGMPTVNLPEVNIIADNPSLSNMVPYEEIWYTPNMNGGGGYDNGWSKFNGWSSDRHSGGSGGGSGKHSNAPPEGTTIHSGNMLFLKTFLRYQIGALNQLGIISEDFWVDAATINIKESDIKYREKEHDYVVNLYNDGDLMQGLALGHIVLNKVGDHEYTIQPDEYDFRIEYYRSLEGNIATIGGWMVHQYGMAFYLPKGTYTIRFYGTVTAKH